MVACKANVAQTVATCDRRELLQGLATASFFLAQGVEPSHAKAPVAVPPVTELCDASCLESLEKLELVSLPSGLQYRDIVVGKGANPPVGFQVVCNYVALTPEGRVFDSSFEKKQTYDIRVGAGQVIPGLDEGILTMKTGGVRRLYIPGTLAFPKGIKAAAGRPSVPAASPVIFDVQLLYIPGVEDDE